MKCTKLISILLCFVLIFGLLIPTSAVDEGDIDEIMCMPNGDLNNDDTFSTDDVIIALKIIGKQIVATEEQLENGDLDRDGYITTTDALLLLKYISGQVTLPEHMYSPWEIVAQPTCTMNGIAKCQCIICSQTFTKYIAPSGHNYNNDVCLNCGDIIQKKSITYKNKEIVFDSTTAVVSSLLGTPKETLVDGRYEILIYSGDYTELGIFTFKDDALIQFYSNSFSSSIGYGTETFILSDVYDYSKAMYTIPFGTLDITVYNDLHNDMGSYSYAFLVSSSKEIYNFKATSDYTINEKLNFHLLNGCRAINNIAPLKYSNKVAAVARNHSSDMAKRNFFDHKNPDGLSSADRITAAGIRWSFCGENIAAGQTDAYHINNGWYNSLSHRSNMLDTDFENVGIGIVFSNTSAYKYYSTQNFYKY